MKKLLGLAAAGITIMLAFAPMLASNATAAEFITKGDNNGNLTVSSTETHHNAYVVGSSAFINSTTTGDLYAAGGNITVEGSVEQDLVVAGGNVTINGTVGGDVRVLGGSVIINSKVGGDVVGAGGNITLTEKSTVGGDAMIAGGMIVFDGPVTGNMKVSGGQVTINNKIDGNVEVISSDSLTFGSKAVVPSKVTHKGSRQSVILEGGQVSSIDYQALPGRAGHDGAGRALLTILTIATVLKILSVILFGILMIKLYPRSTTQLVQHVNDKPWHNLVLGFVGLIVLPIASIILLVTIIGAYIAIMALLVWMVLMVVASIIACIFTGAWIIKKYTKATVLVADWRAVVLGTVVFVLISFVPVIGFLVIFILLLMSFGAVMVHAHGHMKDEQRAGAVVV